MRAEPICLMFHAPCTIPAYTKRSLEDVNCRVRPYHGISTLCGGRPPETKARFNHRYVRPPAAETTLPAPTPQARRLAIVSRVLGRMDDQAISTTSPKTWNLPLDATLRFALIKSKEWVVVVSPATRDDLGERPPM